MNYYKWTYNGTTYDQVDPFKTIPVEDDPDYGRPFWEVIGMSKSEAENIRTNFQWHRVREEREIKLKATDWVSGADVPQAIKDLWFPYRQALRDITTQSDPFNITWPTEPS